MYLQLKDVICISRLVKYKKVDVLIKSFSNLSKKNKNIRLIIVGTGPEEKSL